MCSQLLFSYFNKNMRSMIITIGKTALFSAIAFLGRFSKISSGFHFFGFGDRILFTE